MVNIVGTPGDDDISGTDGDDDLRGLDGNDIIRDALGVNYIDGGLGADTFVFKANTVAGVHVDLGLIGYQDVGGAQFSFNNIEGVYGTGHDDLLVGSSSDESLGGAYGDDTLRGMGGNDILHGDDGRDIVYGGDGDDVLSDFDGGEMYGDDGNDTITVNQDLRIVYSGDSFIIDGGSGDDLIDFLAQRSRPGAILGGDGADTINVRYGSGTIDAGADNDLITVGMRYRSFNNVTSTDFRITTAAGSDTIKIFYVLHPAPTITDFSITSDPDQLDLSYYTTGQVYQDRDVLGFPRPTTYSFANGVLRLVQEGADTLIQAAAGNLYLNSPWSRENKEWSTFVKLENVAAADLTSSHLGSAPGQIWTSGGAGDDTMDGSATADYLIGGAGSDLIRGLDGADALEGGAGADSLQGGLGDDILRGNSDDDLLQGDDGADTLTGGYGGDTFVFHNASESRLFAADFITDLEASEIDRVDLSAIDANTAVAGDQAFAWAAALSGQAGQLVIYYIAARGVSQVQGDIDGDGAPDFVLEMVNNHVPDLGVFIL